MALLPKILLSSVAKNQKCETFLQNTKQQNQKNILNCSISYSSMIEPIKQGGKNVLKTVQKVAKAIFTKIQSFRQDPSEYMQDIILRHIFFSSTAKLQKLFRLKTKLLIQKIISHFQDLNIPPQIIQYRVVIFFSLYLPCYQTIIFKNTIPHKPEGGKTDKIMSLGIRMSVILLKFKLSYDQFKIFIYLVNLMICVRSSCAKVQRLLEEDFNSIENLFDVHYKKSNKVTSIIRTVFAEYFGEVTIFQDNNSSKKKSYQPSSLELLGHKIIELVDEGMKRCFQFAKIREIFELLKHLEQKITGYEEYIKSLERILGLKNDGCEASEDEEEMQLKQIFMKIDRKIQERAQIAALYNDTSELYDREATVCNTSSLYEKEVICSIKDDINHLKEKEAEILYSATTSKSKTLEQQLSAHKNKEFTKRFLKSEFTRDLYQSDGESVLENVQNELTSDQTHPGFYCPEQKKAQRKKAQNLKDHVLKESMRELNPEETHNDSEFAEDLSKHVKPMPSALVNESIEGLVKREQKQDEKKLNILRKSIRGDQNTTHNEGAYQQKIKKVKLQNKLKPTYPFTKRKKLPTEPIHRANPGQRKIEPKAMDKMKKYFKN